MPGAIRKVDPDIIITFGPGGDTGHPYHRMVGAITTEILLRDHIIDELDLYYFSWTREQSEKNGFWNLNYADQSLMDTRISFNDEDEEAAIRSIRCHKSQFTEQEMEDWIQLERDDPSNILYFRKFRRDKQVKTAL